MSELTAPKKARLFFSLFAADGELIAEAVDALAAAYGPVDRRLPVMPFGYTDYYEREFGAGLVRTIVTHAGLIDPADLVGVKIRADAMERERMRDGRRTVNIDPGCVDLARVVLVTGKDYSHRIYLGQGVYADLTLIYRRESGYGPLPWTYPDYASAQFLEFFAQVREGLKSESKGGSA